jgi:hypothetical protein
MKTYKRRHTKKRGHSRKRGGKRGGNLTKIARTASMAVKKVATEYGKNQAQQVFRGKPNVVTHTLKANSKNNKIILPSAYNVKKKGGNIPIPNAPLPKIPLPNIPNPIQPVSNGISGGKKWLKKGGFKIDAVDDLEDRDDDWMITKQ